MEETPSYTSMAKDDHERGKETLERRFTDAYELYNDAIFRFCYFRVFNRERAKELTQEAFLKTWHYQTEQGKTIDNLRAFLYRTARNLIIDDSRKHTTVSLDELREQGFDPTGDGGNSIEQGAEISLIVQHLATVPEPYRMAVHLRYIDRLSPQEIAEITDTPVNTVSVHIHRGIEKLRTVTSEEHLPNDNNQL
ncbi:MAG: RNA polymerase sigma factor [Patescibacteria group bacterium]|jgi:RNA polymerase sigma-70 factor (ECF subfamily)